MGEENERISAAARIGGEGKCALIDTTTLCTNRMVHGTLVPLHYHGTRRGRSARMADRLVRARAKRTVACGVQRCADHNLPFHFFLFCVY